MTPPRSRGPATRQRPQLRGVALAVALATALLPACGWRLPVLSGGAADEHVGGKHVLGAVEYVRVEEAGLDFAARMDTGADASAIHVSDVQLDIPADGDAAVGRPIRFTVVNERGEERVLESVVTDVVSIRTAHGEEDRYRVPLHLSFGDVRKSVLVSLADRSGLTLKLLVGRDWLAGDFVVDVSTAARRRP